MKSNIIPAQQTQLKPLPRLLDQFAKRAVLSKLEKIDKGRLQIIDDKQIYEFGVIPRFIALSHLEAVLVLAKPILLATGTAII